MTVDELKVLITAQTAQLQNEVTKVQKKMNRLEKTAKNTSNGIKKAFNAIKFTAIIAAVIKLTKVCTTAAGDLVEVQNVVDTAFGESANIVNNWSKNVIKQYGMSETAAKRTASTFMAMSNGMGIANKAGTTMAVTLAGLSADLASFWNTSQDEAFTALKSVYTGETETLKKYGVVMTDANLKNFALAKGIKKQYSEMSQAEKVALRYKFVLQTTADAQGDFAKTNTSWANQIKIFKAQMQQLKTIIGTGLVAVLRPVIVELNKMLSVVVEIGNALVRAFSKVFGGKDKTLKVNTKPLDKATESVEGTTEAVNKLKKSLNILSFDELNILQAEDKSDNKDSGLGDIVVDGDIIEEDGVLGKWDKLMEQLANKLKKWKDEHKLTLKFDWPTIKQALITLGQNIIKWIGELSKELWETIKTFLESISFTFLLENLIGTFNKIGEHLAKLAKSIIKLITTILLGVDWNSVLGNVTNGVGFIINGFIDLFRGAVEIINNILNDLGILSTLTELSTAFSAWAAVFDTACEIMVDAALAFYEKGLKPIVEWIGGAFFKLSIHLQGMGIRMGETLGTAGDVIVALAGKVGELVGSLWLLVEPIADAVWDIFLKVLDGIYNIITKILESLHSFDFSSASGPKEIIADTEKIKNNLALVLSVLGGIAAFKLGGELVAFFQLVTEGAGGFLGILGNIETYFTGDSKIVAGATSLGTKLISVFTGIGSFLKQTLTGMGAAYSATVNQIGASSSVFTTVKGLVAGLGAGFKSLWAVITANPITAILAVIAALTAAILYLWQTNERFRNSIIAFWNETLKPIFNELVSILTALWNEHIQPLLEKLKALWDEVIGPLVGNLGETLLPILEVIIKVLATIAALILSSIVTSIKIVADAIGSIIDVIQGVIDFIVGIFTGDWERAWQGLKEIVVGIFDGLTDFFANLFEGIVRRFETAVNSIKSLFGSNKEQNVNVNTNGKRLKAPVAYSLEPTNIPQLASGGVLYKSTLVEAGEYANARNNPEIVTPQSLMKETMESANNAVVNAVYSIGNQISKAVEDKDSNVYMDGDKMTKKITSRQKELSRYGSSSLVMV